MLALIACLVMLQLDIVVRLCAGATGDFMFQIADSYRLVSVEFASVAFAAVPLLGVCLGVLLSFLGRPR